MSGVLRKTLASAGLLAITVGGVALGLPGTASAAPALPTNPNHCGLPTSAPPGSHFRRSFPDCSTCIGAAMNDYVSSGYTKKYYCTYNPSNGLSDEHW